MIARDEDLAKRCADLELRLDAAVSAGRDLAPDFDARVLAREAELLADDALWGWGGQERVRHRHGAAQVGKVRP